MKYVFLFLLILLNSCFSTKTKDMPQDTQAPKQLYDIWALELLQLEDKTLSRKDFNQTPVAEFNLNTMEIMGSDGCNRFFGGIEKLNQEAIVLGHLAGTKMYCPKMESSDLFLKALAQVKTFKIAELKLYFYNSEGQEILKFQKVD